MSNHHLSQLDLSGSGNYIDLTNESPSLLLVSQSGQGLFGRKRKSNELQDYDDSRPSPRDSYDDSYIALTNDSSPIVQLPPSTRSHHERKRMRKSEKVQDLNDCLFKHTLCNIVAQMRDSGPDVLLPTTPLATQTPQVTVFATSPSRALSCPPAPHRPHSHKPHVPSSDENKSPFFTPPGELRNRVYRYALLEEGYIEVTADNWDSHQPGLLQTCKQIRTEALPIFYAENSISVNIHDWNPVVKSRMNKLMIAHRIKQITPCHYFTGTPHWANLEAWLKAVYEKKTPGISDCVGKDRDDHRKMIGVCFLLARKARAHGAPWVIVRDVLWAQRWVLSAFDERWKDNPSE